MPRSPNARRVQAAVLASQESNEPNLHLSQRKPSRSTTWVTPRFSPEGCHMSSNTMHHPCAWNAVSNSGENVASHFCMILTNLTHAPTLPTPSPIRFNAMVDDFVDVGPRRRHARPPQPQGRAQRARTTPQCPSCALQPSHSHPVACRCTGAQLLNFELGAIEFNFILVLAAGMYPHLHHHHQQDRHQI
jgi:hypothetical protein